MKRKRSRLFSAFLCMAVLLGVLPQTTFAAQTVIPEVRLVGMSEISIKKGINAAPVKLTCPGSDEILKYGTSGDGYIYKLMLWNCENGSMQPLCEAVTVEK